jgi:nucleotide-binding universal stress UspA family protein
MQIRTILTAVGGGSASRGVLDTACRLARRFNSHLEALHVRPDPSDTFFLGISPSSAGKFAEAVARKALAAAAAARNTFDTAIVRHALTLCDAPFPENMPTALSEASASWREEIGFSPAAVARRARLFDLVVLGRSGRVVRERSGTTIEDTLLGAGRPVLVAASTALDKLGDRVAVAWNDTPEASRALSAAMPFLMQAGETHVLCFGDMGMDDLVRQLAWYGIHAIGHRFQPLSEQRIETGELILAATRDCGADLLVMGAYGHPPWRKLLFGGATREVLNKSLFPVLLTH